MICLREAVISDANIIYRLNKSSLPIYYAVDELKSFINSSKHIVVIIEERKTPIGYIIGNLEKYKSFTSRRIFLKGHIMSFVVKKEYRGYGYGSLLLREIEGLFIKRFNISAMSLYVQTINNKAICFYERLGYKKYKLLKNYYNSLNEDAYLMYRLIKRRESNNKLKYTNIMKTPLETIIEKLKKKN